MTEDLNQMLVGRTVNLTKTVTTQHLPELRKKPFTFTHYEIAEPDVEAELMKLGSDVRIHLPGTMSTCDYIDTRLNINIDETGLITRVSYG